MLIFLSGAWDRADFGRTATVPTPIAPEQNVLRLKPLFIAPSLKPRVDRWSSAVPSCRSYANGHCSPGNRPPARIDHPVLKAVLITAANPILPRLRASWLACGFRIALSLAMNGIREPVLGLNGPP